MKRIPLEDRFIQTKQGQRPFRPLLRFHEGHSEVKRAKADVLLHGVLKQLLLGKLKDQPHASAQLAHFRRFLVGVHNDVQNTNAACGRL
ncbi:hypothetical protein D3C77_497840 [compost metagenome]